MTYQLLQDFLESDFDSLHAWTTFFHIFNIYLTKYENRGLYTIKYT